MASEVDICNRGLQKLGAKRITSLTEDTVNGRACNASYSFLRDAEIRAHRWVFSIKRATLAADATAPDWGRANAFQLPSDYLKLIEDYPEDLNNFKDWQIEGGKIYTNDSAPLYIRYVARVTDTETMDPLFIEALASKLALELAEELTQSNSKKEDAATDYKEAIARAKKANAFENVAQVPPETTWITARA